MEDFVEEIEEEDDGRRQSGRSNEGQTPSYYHDQEQYMHMNVESVNGEQEVEPIVLNKGESVVMEYILETKAEDVDIMLAQYSLKAGLKKFKEKGVTVAYSEMKQLHDMETFFPRHRRSLIREERVRVLSLLIFLKEKQDGRIKGRTCVNGAPQREYIRKEDAASPTVMTDLVFITSVIDAYDRRHVATYDLPGAFLQ